MNRFLLQLIFGLLPWCALAASNFDEGIKAYHKENYALAAELFEAHLKTDSTDVSAYYNLGLAHYELKHSGKAIWAFSKVLKYSPNDAEAREKIEASYAQLKKPVAWEPQLNRLTSALYGFRSQTWSIGAIVLSCLIGLFIILYARSNQASFKKLMLVLTGFGVLMLIISIGVAAGSSRHCSANNSGIVTQAAIPTYLKSKDKTPVTLTEGMRLEITEALDDSLVNVKAYDGKSYIIKKADLDLI